MAEPQKTQKNEPAAEHDAQPKKGKASKLLTCLIPLLTIALCAAGGFMVGRLFGTRGQAQNVSAAERPDPTATSPPPTPLPPPRAAADQGVGRRAKRVLRPGTRCGQSQ
jgi:hypothetical protein